MAEDLFSSKYVRRPRLPAFSIEKVMERYRIVLGEELVKRS